jgi:uncharacterized phosphatase
MTTLCIVRHGETDWNKLRKFQGREDIPLNRQGKKQASMIAAHLAESTWDGIISSPLKRASDTADIIAKKLKIGPVIEDGAFVERDYGEGSGLTLTEQEAAFPDGLIPGKESDDMLEGRVLRGLQGILDTQVGKRVILVAHGAVINALLKAVSAGALNLGETRIRNTCINILEHDNVQWHIRVYNSVDYLGAKASCPYIKEETTMEKFICYCFHYTASDIKKDYFKNGRSTIMAKIQEEKRKGTCQCAEKNPSGT